MFLYFTVSTISTLFSFSNSLKPIVLPIGISFYTFQALSYVIDIYRKKEVAQKNIIHLGLYISFFPQLIAGPIVRYTTIADQIQNRKVNMRKLSVGICRFIVGLSKKVLLSNTLAIVVDYCYQSSPSYEISTVLAWIGAITYCLQIYYDFSGYSDMAIGLGLTLGFEFEENFNYPFISQSISEFWRRWHISLSTWFKDYVYFPLGGSRVKNSSIMVRNLFIVWLLTGIWHGANMSFVVWGIYNFIFIFIEKVVHFEKIKNYKYIKHIYTLIVVAIGLVIFRSNSLNDAGIYIAQMFGFYNIGFICDSTFMILKEFWLFIIVGILFSIPISKRMNYYLVNKKWYHLEVVFNVMYPIVMILIFYISLTYIVKGAYNPFIYFNF
ncbi:MAG: MBOAT family O-acyltransferase [Coprobacillus sp.]